MSEHGRRQPRAFLSLLWQGLQLAFWHRPGNRVQLAGFAAFLASSVLALLAFAAQDYSSIEPPAEFYADGFHGHASYYLMLLVAAWLAVRVLHRPALWLTLASLATIIGIPWTAAGLLTGEWLHEAPVIQLRAWQVLLALAGFVALFRTVGFLARDTPAPRRLVATLCFVLALAVPWYWQQSSWFWASPEDESAPEQPVAGPVPPTAPAAPGFDAEAVMFRQPALLERSIESVAAQTPGRIELFGVGFAGDGSERVFRNEVEYFSGLMARRFGAPARTLSLVNSPGSLDRVPMATLTNLRAGLAGVAARMDTSEDIVVLFLTSHGSEDHHLYVAMDPLPLHQIRPGDLRSALDDAGLRWRVVIVSACFSGGFVDALRDSRTLVITAARADRSSFGCGSDSEISWFGRAFLAGALNRTIDFERAFDLAAHQIREWELEQGEKPSVPQIAAGAEIRQHLAKWRAYSEASHSSSEPSGTPSNRIVER